MEGLTDIGICYSHCQSKQERNCENGSGASYGNNIRVEILIVNMCTNAGSGRNWLCTGDQLRSYIYSVHMNTIFANEGRI